MRVIFAMLFSNRATAVFTFGPTVAGKTLQETTLLKSNLKCSAFKISDEPAALAIGQHSLYCVHAMVARCANIISSARVNMNAVRRLSRVAAIPAARILTADS